MNQLVKCQSLSLRRKPRVDVVTVHTTSYTTCTHPGLQVVKYDTHARSSLPRIPPSYHHHPLVRDMSSILPDTLNPATLMSRRFRPEQIPDLTGRVAVVTGGSAGIGYFDALALARANAKVIILSANPEHGQHAETDINQNLAENNAKGSVKWYQVDMGSLKNVDKISRTLAQDLDRLDIIICNAGIGQVSFGLTPDGLERHFEVSRRDKHGI